MNSRSASTNLAFEHRHSFVLISLLAVATVLLGALSFGLLSWAIHGMQAHAGTASVLTKAGVGVLLGAGSVWAGALVRSGIRASDRIEHIVTRRG